MDDARKAYEEEQDRRAQEDYDRRMRDGVRRENEKARQDWVARERWREEQNRRAPPQRGEWKD